MIGVIYSMQYVVKLIKDSLPEEMKDKVKDVKFMDKSDYEPDHMSYHLPSYVIVEVEDDWNTKQ